MWDISSSVRPHLSKFFGEVGYGFGNQDLNYRGGRGYDLESTRSIESGRLRSKSIAPQLRLLLNSSHTMTVYQMLFGRSDFITTI